jgi:hypothetical protein
MGWKNVKEHYRISHLVQVVPSKGICIGSPYIHDIIVIGLDGELKRRERSLSNEDLARYQNEMDADLVRLKELVLSQDTFETSITIWTYDGGDIVEKQCEVPEWPNVTHDGQMIYENTHSTDRGRVIEWAKRNAEAYLRLATERTDEAKERYKKCEAMVAEAKADLEKLLVV